MADIVARGFVAPRLYSVFNLDADATAQRVQVMIRDLGKGTGFSRHIHGVVSCLSCRGCLLQELHFALAQFLAVNLASRSLGQLAYELDVTGVFVLAKAKAHGVLDFLYQD